MNGKHGKEPDFRVILFIGFIAIVLIWDGRQSVRAAQSPIKITPVSAASFAPQTPMAPGSIAAIFLDGDVVAPGTVAIGNDTDPSTPEIDLPTLLENLSVEVHGRSAGIFFLSARQWNILLPEDLEPGIGPIVIKDATGVIRASGEIEIAPVAPAIFTANTSGEGAPAAFLLRVFADGRQQIEQAAEFDPATQRFAPKPIDVEGSDELVFLILYLTGARGILDASETRILIGGAEYIPDFVGPAPGFVGLEQVNLRLPRSLPVGLLQIGFVYLTDGRAANACEIEIAPPAGLPPSIRGLSKAEALAGEAIEITGTGFTPDSEVLISDATRKVHNAQMMEAGSTSLKVVVPYGSGTGNLIVRNARGEASFPFRMRTSMSGIVQRVTPGPDGEERIGVRNATIRMMQNNVERTTMTSADGSFLMPDVEPTARLTFEVDGATNGLLPLPKDRRSLPILANRDNQYEGYIELKEISGASSFAGSNGVMRHQLAAPVRGSDEAAQPSPVEFDPQGSVARFPDGTVLDNITATVLDPGRVPANLPPSQFSSTIVQLTQFGAALDPGGKLTFPNTDGYAANETVTLYRFDQTAGSNTLGSFVAAGQARVTADGMRVETASNAIKETTYYFVSKTRPITTIYGKVVEEIAGGAEQPARGALVQVRGQSIFSLTDQSGTFTLRNAPIPDAAVLANGFGIEVSFLRPDGTVDRVDREGVTPGMGGLTLVSPPIRIVSAGRSRAPVIQAPKNLTVEAGRQSEFAFLAYARVAGRTLTDVSVLGAAFATVANLGNDRYVLRLAPGMDAAGTYQLELQATDSQGETISQAILLEVKEAQVNTPIALSQSVETGEDQPVGIVLTGVGGAQFRVISDPRRGRLSGTAPDLVYMPDADFNGTDSFSFVAGNGETESAAAEVTVNVRSVEDAPRLTVGESYSLNLGRRLGLVINGYDGDAGQTLTLAGAGLPMGALIRQRTATSWVLEWQPTGAQVGSHTITLMLSDDGTPVRSDTRTVTIIINETWAQTSGPEGGIIQTFASIGPTLYFGGNSMGVYRTTDDGVSWAPVNNGLRGRNVFALAAIGRTLFAGTGGGGVSRTTDNGANWVVVNNGLGNTGVRTLFAVGATLYAGTQDGVFRSTDLGDSWTAVSDGLPDNRVRAFALIGTTLYAGTLGGICRITDNGAGWTAINEGLDNPVTFSLAVIGTTLYAGTDGGGVYRRAENGDSWSQINNGLTASTIFGLGVNGTTLYAGTLNGGVFRSTNNGSSWTQVNDGLTSPTVLSFGARGARFFAGTQGGGVFLTMDGANTWSAANSGLDGLMVFALAANGTEMFAGTQGGGVFRTGDKGVVWTAVNNGLSAGFINALAVSGTALFAGTQGGGVFRTTDNGEIWIPAGNGLTVENQSGVTVLSLAASDSALFAGVSGGGVFRTVNSGISWTPASNGLGDRSVSALAVRGATLFAGTQDGGVFRTSDNGANWTSVNNGLTAMDVRALTFSGTTLFAGTSGGIFRSADDGDNWTQVNNGLTVTDVWALAVTPSALYAGTIEGPFRTTDDGDNWAPSIRGLVARNLRALALNGTTLFSGATGGIQILDEAETTWSGGNAGLANGSIHTISAGNGRILAGTFGGGVYSSIDGGANWAASNAGLPASADVRAFTRHGSGVFAGLYGEGVYVSMDDGGNWESRSAGLGNLQVNALASDGTRIIAATEGGVWRSTDNGVSWSVANTGITRQKILSLLAAPSGLYAGTDLGVFHSTSGGETWTAINAGLADLHIVSLGLAPDRTTLLAGTGSGVFRLSGNGANWEAVTTGLPGTGPALVFLTSGTRLLAGMVYGFFVSDDNGMSWRRINTALLNLRVGGLAVEGNRVIAGTRSTGTYFIQLN